MSQTASPSYFVLVDFENVPSVDLTLIAGKPVHVTLFIGEKQKRLDLALVRQIHRQASQVTLVEVGSSGRNALDLVLAAHLGRGTIEHPAAEFTIISKDHDFDPLIAHLCVHGVRVERQPEFTALTFLGLPKRAHVAKPHIAASKIVRATPRASPTPDASTRPTGKMEKLVARLMSSAGPHPKRKDRLLHHISTSFGNQLSDADIAEVADELVARGIVVIDPAGKVSYPGRS
jgi:hypothetical protein